MTIRTFISLLVLVCIGKICVSEELSPINDRIVSTHDDIVQSVVLSQDGHLVASAGFDGKVLVRRTDDHAMSPTIVNLTNTIQTISFSKDKKYVYAAGNYNGYKIAKIKIGPGNIETINPNVSGTICLVHENEDETLTIVTAENRIIRFSPVDPKITFKADIFGGFIGAKSITADGAFVAVSSQNIKGLNSTEPCKMTVFDKECKPVFSYQYESVASYDGAQHAFGHDRILYLITKQHFFKFLFDKESGKWKPLTDVTSKLGRPSAIAVAGNPDRIWIAYGQHVLEINPDTCAIITDHYFNYGPKKGKYASDGINSIAVNLDANIMAVACQDGTIRISSLQDRKQQQKAPADSDKTGIGSIPNK